MHMQSTVSYQAWCMSSVDLDGLIGSKWTSEEQIACSMQISEDEVF